MSTPERPVQDARFKEGDTFQGLTRNATGKWLTWWGLWALSDQHVRRMCGMQQHYVAGFLIDDDTRTIALGRKGKPAWQAGKLNGIGGKIEDGEDGPGVAPSDAQV